MTIRAVILAAGRGSRMGGPDKLLLPIGGRPVLQHVLDAAEGAGLGGAVVVLGHAAERIAAAITLPAAATLVRNPEHADGQATSLRAGLAALDPGVGAALILLGDQPGVRADAIRALADAHRPDGAAILRAAYRGRPGHPVLLARAVWEEAMALRGDQGARALIAREAGRIALVEVGGAPPDDLDTPADYARLR